MFARIARRAGITLLFVSLMARAAVAQSPASPGAYTEEQATRGGRVFSNVCIECHARKEMSDSVFRVNWNGRTAFDLFERIRSTMPESGPGSLPRTDYLDVTTYLMKLNGMPAGSVALADDEVALKKQLLALVASMRAHVPSGD
jgi:hypothetical protein